MRLTVAKGYRRDRAYHLAAGSAEHRTPERCLYAVSIGLPAASPDQWRRTVQILKPTLRPEIRKPTLTLPRPR